MANEIGQNISLSNYHWLETLGKYKYDIRCFLTSTPFNSTEHNCNYRRIPETISSKWFNVSWKGINHCPCNIVENGTILFQYHWSSRRNALHKKIKFSIKDFFSKCDQIRSKLQIWSHLLKKSLLENFIFCAVVYP